VSDTALDTPSAPATGPCGKDDMKLNTRVQKDHPGSNSRVRLDGPGASSGRSRFSPLVGTLFLLPICWGSATPARADVTVDGTRSSAAVATRATMPHTLFQTSTINALLEGVYDGDLPVATLRQHGDFGLGTLNGLDGEMVQVDGQVFQIRSDGKARLVPDDARVPFADTTFFHADRSVTVEKPLSFQQMTAYLDTLLPSRNLFYAIRIEGTFAFVRTRSVPRQAKPYPRLAEVVKTQPTFQFRNQRGVMVGFWTPNYATGFNVPGYHFHFLTADRTGGGHVLECTLGRVKISVDDTPRFTLDLPRTREFQAAILDTDRRSELNQVEK
jgi:acetolactate decarboxylase